MVVCELRQLVGAPVVHAGIASVRVIGRPDCSRKLAPKVISYGKMYEAVDLNKCRRPSGGPCELISALGEARLVCSTVVLP